MTSEEKWSKLPGGSVHYSNLGGSGLHLQEISPDGSDWRPTVRSIVETHEPFFNLMVSYALPWTSSRVRHMFKPALDAKAANGQVPVIYGLIRIKSPARNWDQIIGEQDTLEVEMPLSIAKALFLFEAPIENEITFSGDGDRVRIAVKGTMGLSLLQGKLTLFLRNKLPDFWCDFGGDTEVFVRPQKFGYNA